MVFPIGPRFIDCLMCDCCGTVWGPVDYSILLWRTKSQPSIVFKFYLNHFRQNVKAQHFIFCFPRPQLRECYDPKYGAAQVFLFEPSLPGLPPNAEARRRRFPCAECLPFPTRELRRAIIRESG